VAQGETLAFRSHLATEAQMKHPDEENGEGFDSRQSVHQEVPMYGPPLPPRRLSYVATATPYFETDLSVKTTISQVYVVLQPTIRSSFLNSRTPQVEKELFGDFEDIQIGIAVAWNEQRISMKYQVRNDMSATQPLIETCQYLLDQGDSSCDRLCLIGDTDLSCKDAQQFCIQWTQNSYLDKNLSLKFVNDFAEFITTRNQAWKCPVRVISSNQIVFPLMGDGFRSPVDYVRWKILDVLPRNDARQDPAMECEFHADVLEERLSLRIESKLNTDSLKAPDYYVPSDNNQVPFLNIVIMVVGSRGDVQPFVALGKELQSYGHRVRLATHETFRSFVTDHALEFYPLAGNPEELMAFMVKNPGLIPKLETIREGEIQAKREMIEKIIESTWKACTEPDDFGRPFETQAIISNPPTFGHIHCAELLSIPLHSNHV
jgi:hypothetical protein